MDKRENDPAHETGSASSKAPENRLPRRQGSPGKVIALLNQKGGAGKTTLGTHLAGELAMAGGRVTLLDADPQGSPWTGRNAAFRTARNGAMASSGWRGIRCTRRRRRPCCRRTTP